jgi:hypothetical protein
MFPVRKLVASAAVSLTAAVGFGVLLPVSPASAEVLPNSNSVHLGSYRVPATPPAYSASTPVLPEVDGTTGRPTQISMTGDASLGTNAQVLTASPGPGETTKANGPVYTAPSGFAHQTWYFQRVGYVGVINPSVNPEYSTRLATPVYKIIHYETNGPECVIADGSASSGTAVETFPCDVGGYNDTEELWLIGSPGRTNNIIDSSTGAFTGAYANQFYSPALQSAFAGGAPDYQHSVIENLSSVDYHRWDVTQATVMSAAVNNANGTDSTVDVLGQTQSPVNSSNSTWNLVAI